MNVSEFWQKLRACKTMRALQAVIKGERARLQAAPQAQEPPRFVFGAPKELKGWLPTKTMTVHKEFFTSERYMSTYTRADYRCARGDIDLFAARVIEQARRRNVPLYAHTVWRSPAEQTRMVEKGHSKTRPPTAAHVQGYAVDIVHAVHHWDLSDHEWFLIGQIGKAVARQMKIKVRWGGDWGANWEKGRRGWDPAHWEVSGWTGLPQYTVAELERKFPHKVHKCPRAILSAGPKL